MAEKHTPSLGAIRTWYALDRAVNGEDQEFEQGIEEFDRAPRKHDAALIEALADAALDESTGIPFDADEDLAIVSAWLREKARERREGVS